MKKHVIGIEVGGSRLLYGLFDDQLRLHGGDVGYARRPGTHCFSRADWQNICDFMHEKL